MSDLKRLKVVTSRMAGYTGVLGRVRFKDGISEEALPRHIRDQMGACMELVEIDEFGNEQPAGPQYRLIHEANLRAPVKEPLQRQTEAEKEVELTVSALEVNPNVVIETRETLEQIASEKGIAGLREIAKRWNVKHRSMVVLIEMILEAQDKHLAKIELERQRRFEAKDANELKAKQSDEIDVDDAPDYVPPAAEQPDEGEASEETSKAAAKLNETLEAARSGDFAAALSTEE